MSHVVPGFVFLRIESALPVSEPSKGATFGMSTRSWMKMQWVGSKDAWLHASVAAKSLHLGVQEKCQSKVCLFYPRHGTTWTWCSSKNLAAESFKVEDALCKTSDDTVSWLQKWRNQHSMNQRERHIEGLVFLVNPGSKP